MKLLITGANGFIGKNLITELKNRGYNEILPYTRDSGRPLLEKYTKECDFVFHLAGVNRPLDEKEFFEGNAGFTEELLGSLREHGNQAPILMTSSIQVEMDNPYGRSKLMAEELVLRHSRETGAKSLIYRLPNVFGKWCRPHYNSVVATFCHNIARDLEIQIHDPDKELTLCHIDDVVAEFIRAMEGKGQQDIVSHKIKLGALADKLYTFRKNRETLVMPSLETEFERALYSTFLSYLEEDSFSYHLKKNTDQRGWLAEFIKSSSMGQIFISKTKPGITRGNHWHHTKVEKFLVIQGEAVIQFRKIDTENVLEYRVNGDEPEVVDIPPGYTHSITNIGTEDVITLFWASEIFNPEKPDTYYLEV
jgi:UDP-2-acetamido-2,6-beta-L-arabino-hexul-4-ose reductase